MIPLAKLAGQALRLAERQAEAKARRAVLKAGGGAVAALFFCIAVGFAAFGGYMLLSAGLGPVAAAFVMALLALGLGALVLLIAGQVARSRARDSAALPPEIEQQLETLSREAGQEIGKAAPYIVLAGFLAGFLSGRK